MAIKQIINQCATNSKALSDKFYHGRYAKFLTVTAVIFVGPGTLLQLGVTELLDKVEALRGRF